MHAHTCTYAHTNSHVRTHAYTLTHMHTHTDIHAHTLTHTHTYTYAQIYLHTCTQTHMHTYRYTHRHIHIHTHIHTHAHTRARPPGFLAGLISEQPVPRTPPLLAPRVLLQARPCWTPLPGTSAVTGVGFLLQHGLPRAPGAGLLPTTLLLPLPGRHWPHGASYHGGSARNCLSLR